MSFTYKDKELLYDGKKIFSTPSLINDILTTEFNTCVIVYDAYDLIPYTDRPFVLVPDIADPELQKLVNQNVLCIDKSGQVIWRIEATSKRPHDHVEFLGGAEGLWTHRRDGEEFQIDKNTGKILAQRLGAR